MTVIETTVAAFLADIWINVARQFGDPITEEREQEIRSECDRFLRQWRFS